MSDMNRINLVALLKEAGEDELAENVFHILFNIDDEIKTLKKEFYHTKKDIDELKKALDVIHRAFPNDDIHGHRLYHEKIIRTVIANEEVKNSLKIDIVQKVTWFVVLLVIAGLGLKLGISGL